MNKSIVIVLTFLLCSACSTVQVESESVNQHVAHGVGQAVSAVSLLRNDAEVYSVRTRATSSVDGITNRHVYSQTKSATGNEKNSLWSIICLPVKMLALEVDLVNSRGKQISLTRTKVNFDQLC